MYFLGCVTLATVLDDSNTCFIISAECMWWVCGFDVWFGNFHSCTDNVFCHLLLGFCRPHADWTITYKLPHICALSSVKEKIEVRVFIVHKCDWDDCESTIYWKKDTKVALLDWTQWRGGCWVILSLIQEPVTDSRSGGTVSIPVTHTHTHAHTHTHKCMGL